jgi:indolepyruvate ferredoxin oxidoreductase
MPSLEVPGAALNEAIAERVRGGPLHAIDAHDYAVRLFGDSIGANMFLLGYAYQLGHVPVGHDAIEQAIELNGAAVAMNREAFRFGRLAAHDRTALDRIAAPHATPRALETLDEIVAYRAHHLAAYQDEALAERYRIRVRALADIEAARTPGSSGLAIATARAYHKLLAYKDEYEVARLYTDGSFAREVEAQFEGVRRVEFHLAPPILSRFYKDKRTGAPRKIRLGGWMMPVFRLLARGKTLRGTRWDLFGYTAERRLERQMIADYERLLDEIGSRLSPATHATAVALARLPEDVKGFGHIKDASLAKAKKREALLLAELRNPAPVKVAAE